MEQVFDVVSLDYKPRWLCLSPAVVLKNHLWLKALEVTVTGGYLPSVIEELRFGQEIARFLELLWFNL